MKMVKHRIICLGAPLFMILLLLWQNFPVLILLIALFLSNQDYVLGYFVQLYLLPHPVNHFFVCRLILHIKVLGNSLLNRKQSNQVCLLLPENLL